jgi:radical SAM protein with 4Fe4S-binding SPASM domain
MTAALVEIELDLGGSGGGRLDASELGLVLADARDLGARKVWIREPEAAPRLRTGVDDALRELGLPPAVAMPEGEGDPCRARFEGAPRGPRCRRLPGMCLVRCDGAVWPCIGVPIVLGDVRRERLPCILAGSEVLEDLGRHHETLHGDCGGCEMGESCHGCRGAAHRLAGSYLASDPLCGMNRHPHASGGLPCAAGPLVPHAPPMRMVDELLEIGERSAVTRYTVPADSPFADGSGRLAGEAALEIIAQAAAALNGYRNRQGGGDGRPEGLLLGCRELRVEGEIRAGDRIEVRLRKLARLGPFGIVSAEVHGRGTRLASGEIKLWHPARGETASPPSAGT